MFSSVGLRRAGSVPMSFDSSSQSTSSSEQMLSSRVLKHKIQLPGEQIQEILTFLESLTVQPKPITSPSIPVRDEDDQWVLAFALAVKADVFVTGDKDLLDVAKKVSGITITDPRGFWNLAKKQPRK